MLARHFAVADDVDAGVFLQFDRQQRGVELALRELVACKLPLRPELVRLGEPGRLRQTAGDGGGKHHASTPLTRLGRAPTIEPILAREQLFSADRAHREIAHQRFRPAQPIDAALLARGLLGARGAQAARAFIAAQRVGRVVAEMREEMREHRGILDRHAGALREEGQHRVGGIPDQRDRPIAAAERAAAAHRAPISASAPAARSARALFHAMTSARNGEGFRRGRRRPTSRACGIRRARCRRC